MSPMVGDPMRPVVERPWILPDKALMVPDEIGRNLGFLPHCSSLFTKAETV